MIEDTDLRIGNLVIDGKTGTIVSVDGIQFSGRIVTYDETYDDTKRRIDSQPIPLTPEILEKCGFERAYPDNGVGFDHYEKKGLTGLIYKRGDNAFEYELTKTTVKHLHQLQNLYFALTGEELNVQL